MVMKAETFYPKKKDSAPEWVREVRQLIQQLYDFSEQQICRPTFDIERQLRQLLSLLTQEVNLNDLENAHKSEDIVKSLKECYQLTEAVRQLLGTI